MAEQVLHVLVIDCGLLAAQPPQDAPSGDSMDSSCRPRLQHLATKGIDEAVSVLRLQRVDAILVGQRDPTELARLQACAAGLPILMITEEIDALTSAGAIAAGADDVLLPPDLTDQSLLRRIQLAIARKTVEHQRLSAARKDRLTGLANITLLEERFNRAIARSDRSATLVGLVAIDLDGFEQLIGSYGQRAADDLLSTIAKRLLNETRQTDTLARTRHHGFTWLVEGLPAIDDISALVNRLPDQLAGPFAIGGDTIRITASVGIAICPFHGRDFQIVHAMAEAAMTDVSSISGDSLLMLPIPTAPAGRGDLKRQPGLVSSAALRSVSARR